jgi:hypothetical protein
MHAETPGQYVQTRFTPSAGQDQPQPSLASRLEETGDFESTLCLKRLE